VLPPFPREKSLFIVSAFLLVSRMIALIDASSVLLLDTSQRTRLTMASFDAPIVRSSAILLGVRTVDCCFCMLFAHFDRDRILNSIVGGSECTLQFDQIDRTAVLPLRRGYARVHFSMYIHLLKNKVS